MRLSKAATKKVQQKKPPENFSPKIVQNISSPYIKKASIHKFSSHHEVPVFEVSDYRALNQLIGYEMRKDLGLKKVKKGKLLAFFINDIKSALKTIK